MPYSAKCINLVNKINTMRELCKAEHAYNNASNLVGYHVDRNEWIHIRVPGFDTYRVCLTDDQAKMVIETKRHGRERTQTIPLNDGMQQLRGIMTLEFAEM
jgi:hypothetical protein